MPRPSIRPVCVFWLACLTSVDRGRPRSRGQREELACQILAISCHPLPVLETACPNPNTGNPRAATMSAVSDDSSSDFRAAYARLVSENSDERVRSLLSDLSGLMQAPPVLGFAATGKLRGAEKAAFQAAIVSYLDWLRWHEAYHDSMSGQLPPFDLLSPFHRLCIVADLAVGLLVGNTALPPESVEHHAGFQAMFLHLMDQIELEIDNELNEDAWGREDGREAVGENGGSSLPEVGHANGARGERGCDANVVLGEESDGSSCLFKDGSSLEGGDRRAERRARIESEQRRKDEALVEIEDLAMGLDAESELERMTKVMEDMFGDDEDSECEDEGPEEREIGGEKFVGETSAKAIPVDVGADSPSFTSGNGKETVGAQKGASDGENIVSGEQNCDPFRYYWRGLLNRMILERHAANPLLNGPAASELHVAAQSTVCPEKTCTDVERWIHSHRMVLGAGFHVDPQESYLTNGFLNIDAVAKGDVNAVRRFDIVTKRVDQKGREFGKTWTVEKGLLARRTIHVLGLDDDVAAMVGSPGQDLSSLTEIERGILDVKKAKTSQDDYILRNAAQQLWRRRFLQHMEGKQWSNLQARLRALKRTMDSERALGLHELVAQYHALESEFGLVTTHSDWIQLAEVNRIWKKGEGRRIGSCALCQKKAEEGQKFKVCGKCFMAEYCSREVRTISEELDSFLRVPSNNKLFICSRVCSCLLVRFPVTTKTATIFLAFSFCVLCEIPLCLLFQLSNCASPRVSFLLPSCFLLRLEFPTFSYVLVL